MEDSLELELFTSVISGLRTNTEVGAWAVESWGPSKTRLADGAVWVHGSIPSAFRHWTSIGYSVTSSSERSTISRPATSATSCGSHWPDHAGGPGFTRAIGYRLLGHQPFDLRPHRQSISQEPDPAAPNHTGAFSELYDAFLGGLSEKALLADLGCGPGLDSARFVQEGFRVLGMDLSAGMLSNAAETALGRLVQADLRALPIEDGRLDGIWCVAALLHVPERDTTQVLREFRRTMGRIGNLALVTALGESSRFEAVPYAPNEHRWFVYRRRDRLIEQVQKAGFSIEWADQAQGSRTWLTLLGQAV